MIGATTIVKERKPSGQMAAREIIGQVTMGGLGAKGGSRGQTAEEPMLMVQHHVSRPHHDEYMVKKANNNTEDYQESVHLHERTSFMAGNYTKSISS